MTFTIHKIMKPIAIASIMLLMLLPVEVHAQAIPLTLPHIQLFDANGQILSNGRVFTYAAGTTTLTPTYTDSSGAFANTNPIILDGGGYADIWLGNQSYKFVVQDQNGVQQWTSDNVTGYLGILNLTNDWTFPQTFEQPITIRPADNQINFGSALTFTTFDVPPAPGPTVLHFQNSTGSDSVVNRNSTDILLNKTLTSPVINTPTINSCPFTNFVGTCVQIANDAAGTTLNKLAKISTAVPSTVLTTTTVDLQGAIGVVVAGAGTTGNAVIVTSGIANCIFDTGLTAGDYVQLSITVAGDCASIGANYPINSKQILGRALASGIPFGPAIPVLFFGPGIVASPPLQKQVVSSTYFNASTTFSTIPNFTFTVTPNTNYSLRCNFIWQASANTAGPKFQINPTSATGDGSLSMNSSVTATTSIYTAAQGGSLSQTAANSGTVTTATDLPLWLTGTLQVSATGGSFDVQAAANGAGTLTIQTGDCTLQ